MPATREREVKLKDGTLLTGSAAQKYGRPLTLASETTESPNAMAPITTASAASETPIEIPDMPPATEAAGLRGELTAMTSGTTNEISRRREELQRKDETFFEQYIKSQAETEGEVTLQDREFSKEGGVDDVQKELDVINDSMRKEEARLLAQIQAIEAGAGSFAGKQAGIAEAERVSLRKQADLAIKQMSIQGRYDSAREIADRAIAVELEQDKHRNDILKTISERYYDLFTTAEKRELDAMEKERDREYEAKEYRLRAEWEQKLKQADPLYKAQVRQALASAQKAEIEARNAVTGVSLGGTLNGKPQTTTQATIQGYADRTLESNKIISAIGFKFTGFGSLFGQSLPGFFKNSERKQYEQAQRNFVNAVLRRESGAVISKEEFDNASQQYFPQPGDPAEVVAQKEANRNTVISNLYLAANKARPAEPGSIIEDQDGTQYRVGLDGETLEPI